jgi:DDE superfamily endonuclease
LPWHESLARAIFSTLAATQQAAKTRHPDHAKLPIMAQSPWFGGEGNQSHARRFVEGLLHRGERRNTENIAEAMNGGPVRSLQAFIATGGWADQDVLAEIRRCALNVLADEGAVWNCDETGFPKKGAKSVGVKRQYSGTLGRTDNCQVAVFANYSSAKGHTFIADFHTRKIINPLTIVPREKPRRSLSYR